MLLLCVSVVLLGVFSLRKASTRGENFCRKTAIRKGKMPVERNASKRGNVSSRNGSMNEKFVQKHFPFCTAFCKIDDSQRNCRKVRQAIATNVRYQSSVVVIVCALDRK